MKSDVICFNSMSHWCHMSCHRVACTVASLLFFVVTVGTTGNMRCFTLRADEMQVIVGYSSEESHDGTCIIPVLMSVVHT